MENKDNHEFPEENWHNPNIHCSKYLLETQWTIPNNTLSILKPSMNAVKIVIFNATAASVNPDFKEIYCFSPGFYLTDDRNTSSALQEIIVEGTDMTGQGDVKPPSGRTIATHGAVGIGAGLAVLLIALLSQWLFFGYRRRKDGRTERGSWQEKINLT